MMYFRPTNDYMPDRYRWIDRVIPFVIIFVGCSILIGTFI